MLASFSEALHWWGPIVFGILEHSVSQCCMYAPKILEMLDFFSLYMTHSDTYNYPAKRARTVPNDA